MSLFSSLGKIAGTILGGFVGGPTGAAIGGKIGGELGGRLGGDGVSPGNTGDGIGPGQQKVSSAQTQNLSLDIDFAPQIGVGVTNVIDTEPIARALDRGQASINDLFTRTSRATAAQSADQFERADQTDREIALANVDAQVRAAELSAAGLAVQAQGDVAAATITARAAGATARAGELAGDRRHGDILQLAKLALLGAGAVMVLKRAA